MTMHLVRGMSSTRTAKPKDTKLTASKRKELGDQLAEHNRQLKQQGRHNERLSFEEYLDYVHGRGKAKPTKPTKPAERKLVPRYRRSTQHIPSLDQDPGVALKKESTMYTGTLIKGVATMHKSNAVPVINDEEIIAIRHMRR